jgi:hypothetical protein
LPRKLTSNPGRRACDQDGAFGVKADTHSPNS